MQVYVHVGIRPYSEEGRFPVRNNSANHKPYGGLWACREGAKEDWRTLLKDRWGKDPYEECETLSIDRFVLKPWAKVFYIREYQDIEKMPKIKDENLEDTIDYRQMQKDGWDAVEVQYFEKHRGTDPELEAWISAWDCDSICVMNPEAYEMLMPET